MSKSRKRQQQSLARRLKITRKKLAESKRRIDKRNEHKVGDNSAPVFTMRSVRFEIADRTQATCYRGGGHIHRLAHQSGLVSAIDRRLELLKVHFPYFESDHVLNIAYNALSGGRCLEDLEPKRNDKAYLNLIGATRIPDPTTAGDFCRRFESKADIDALHDAIDDARHIVWARQPHEFFERAIVDMDGHTVETTGECKEGMDINFEGRWGYHPPRSMTGRMADYAPRARNAPCRLREANFHHPQPAHTVLRAGSLLRDSRDTLVPLRQLRGESRASSP